MKKSVTSLYEKHIEEQRNYKLVQDFKKHNWLLQKLQKTKRETKIKNRLIKNMQNLGTKAKTTQKSSSQLNHSDRSKPNSKNIKRNSKSKTAKSMPNLRAQTCTLEESRLENTPVDQQKRGQGSLQNSNLPQNLVSAKVEKNSLAAGDLCIREPHCCYKHKQQFFCKHNLPVCTSPLMTKYQFPCQQPIANFPIFKENVNKETNTPNISNVSCGSQTNLVCGDDVAMLEFLKTSGITTLEKLKGIIESSQNTMTDEDSKFLQLVKTKEITLEKLAKIISEDEDIIFVSEDILPKSKLYDVSKRQDKVHKGEIKVDKESFKQLAVSSALWKKFYVKFWAEFTQKFSNKMSGHLQESESEPSNVNNPDINKQVTESYGLQQHQDTNHFGAQHSEQDVGRYEHVVEDTHHNTAREKPSPVQQSTLEPNISEPAAVDAITRNTKVDRRNQIAPYVRRTNLQMPQRTEPETQPNASDLRGARKRGAIAPAPVYAQDLGCSHPQHHFIPQYNANSQHSSTRYPTSRHMNYGISCQYKTGIDYQYGNNGQNYSNVQYNAHNQNNDFSSQYGNNSVYRQNYQNNRYGGYHNHNTQLGVAQSNIDIGQQRFAGTNIQIGQQGVAGSNIQIGQQGIVGSNIQIGQQGVAGSNIQIGQQGVPEPNIQINQQGAVESNIPIGQHGDRGFSGHNSSWPTVWHSPQTTVGNTINQQQQWPRTLIANSSGQLGMNQVQRSPAPLCPVPQQMTNIQPKCWPP